MPVKPYNPLDKNSIGDNIVKELMFRPCVPLPTTDAFEGAGLYAIYYSGSFPAYAPLAADNQDGQCRRPIYIGKADPRGGRKGGIEMDAGSGTSLYSRLKDHAEPIAQATNLELSDFRCRWLVVDEVWMGLGKRTAIRTHLPLWNTKIDGFGNHDPGNRRATQYRSDWDTVHPGRSWATKRAQGPKTAEQTLSLVQAPLSQGQLELLAAESLQNEETQ